MTSTRRDTRGRSTAGATAPLPGGDADRAAGNVESAVLRDLDGLAILAPELARSTLAATAVALAREIDSSRNSATSKSMCARELREAMNRLLELAPAPETNDRIDQLGAETRRKLAGGTAA